MTTSNQKKMADVLLYLLEQQREDTELKEELQVFATSGVMTEYVKDVVDRLLAVNEPPVVERIS